MAVLQKSRKGQFGAVKELGPLALALVLLAITVGMGAVVLSDIKPSTWQTQEVTDETHSPATPLPTNVTVGAASNIGFEEIETGTVSIVLEDTDPETGTATNKTVPSGNYTVFNDDGIIRYEDLGGNYSETEDRTFVDYRWADSSGEGTQVIDDGLSAMADFGGWFGTLVILGVVTIIFLFLGVIRRAGEASQA